VSVLESPSTRRVEQRWVLVGIGLVVSLLCAQVVAGFVRADEPSFLEKVETCLTERATPFGEATGDPIALSAKRGALRTTVDGNSVTVSLGGSESDAERLYEAYTAVASDDVVANLLDRRRKVVFLWSSEPTTAMREFMILCTLDAQE
jgi:hypothetical protein